MPISARGVRRTTTDSFYTKPYLEDAKQIDTICRNEGRTRGDVLRRALHEWLRERRLRTIGRDLTTSALREFQSDLLRKELAPIRELLEENKRVRQHQTALIDDTNELVLQLHQLSRQTVRDSMRVFDLLWEQLLVPLLQRSNPNITEAEIEQLRIDDDRKWEERVAELLEELRRAQRDDIP